MFEELTKVDILKAFNYIDENGVPNENRSTRYDLINDEGKVYPPKYVIAVSRFLKNGEKISLSFNSIDAIKRLEKLGFVIKDKETYEITITKDYIKSTEDVFSINNISAGDNYSSSGVYFKPYEKEPVYRKYEKNEKRNSNRQLPYLVMQVFEDKLLKLSDEDRLNFPICKYSDDGLVAGIYKSIEEAKNKGENTFGFVVYTCNNGKELCISSWNVFSTLLFAQECLKRYGDDGDAFVLTYKKKDKESNDEDLSQEDEIKFTSNNEYLSKYKTILFNAKNVIFRGAPGTGKSYLAKELASYIISNGKTSNFEELTNEQKEQFEFVQFHPNYDYSDFVEGLRPSLNDDGTMGFELQDGIFKKFIEKAKDNFDNNKKTQDILKLDYSIQEAIDEFFNNVDFNIAKYETTTGNKFAISSFYKNRVYIHIPENQITKDLSFNVNDIKRMLESGEEFKTIKDISKFFDNDHGRQIYSYIIVIYNKIKVLMKSSKNIAISNELKNFVFVIDEINRGEISKIFGELFYSIDPGYRGKKGEIATQFSNMHSNLNDKFYVPENVYIIGTMNDIDKSVDTFDFAMRRRFRFVEIKPEERLGMLDCLDEKIKDEAIKRMTSLNNEIVNTEDLNENYQIGAAYFVKLNDGIGFEELWTDYLEPLLQEYVNGMSDESSIMSRFKKAYDNTGIND